MKPANPRILTINGGSSSTKVTLFEAGDPLRRILAGGVERVGLPEATLRVKGLNQEERLGRVPLAAGTSRGAWWTEVQGPVVDHQGTGLRHA